MTERELKLRKLVMENMENIDKINDFYESVRLLYKEFSRPFKSHITTEKNPNGPESIVNYEALESFSETEKFFFYSVINLDASPDIRENGEHLLQMPCISIPDEYYPIDYYDFGYRKTRLEVLLRNGEKCAKCGVKPNKNEYLTIDHIKPVSKYPELFLDKENMQVLCFPCNKKKSNKHQTDYRK